MQAVDLALVADRLLVLSEAEAIGADLAALEQRRGQQFDDLRQRVQRVRLIILTELLLALLATPDAPTRTIH